MRWYHELLDNEPLFEAFKTSITIAGVSTITTVLLGLGFSLMWLRLRAKSRTILELLCITPIALPGLFIGVSLLIFFAEIQLNQSWITIAIAHVLLALPVLAITMRARLVLYDNSLDEAARDLGASEFKTLMYVTLPLIGPFVFACGLLAFAISFDEFVLTFFRLGHGNHDTNVYLVHDASDCDANHQCNIYNYTFDDIINSVSSMVGNQSSKAFRHWAR